MASACPCRFVLLDFGYPMNANSMSNIINSLENILALVLAFPRNAREMALGISILNSDFIIFGSESHLRRNYGSIIKNLKASLKTSKPNSRVTVQEYMYLLSGTVETVLQEYEKFMKANNLSIELSKSMIRIAVVTKKTASVLAEILMDVTSKLQKSRQSLLSEKNYKIVHVLANGESVLKSSDKNMLIDWSTCSDNIYDLNCFFKEWLINQQTQLQILLSKELNVEVHCEVDDCTVNPFSIILDGRLGVLQPPCQLEVIRRLPANGFCPTFVLGIPRRVTATSSCVFPWTESQINSQIFNQLCQRLYHKGEGLLAKLVPPAGKEAISTFHLLTSDGNMLLMNDVAPEELHLPKPDGFSKSVASSGDESAATLVGACFESIKYLNEYKPKHYSSGIYEYLKDHLVKTGQNTPSFGHFDPDRSFGRKRGRKDNSKSEAKECTDETPAGDKACEIRKKRQRSRSEIEAEGVHPALLSANVVEKYRKVRSEVFDLPELSNRYNDNSE